MRKITVCQLMLMLTFLGFLEIKCSSDAGPVRTGRERSHLLNADWKFIRDSLTGAEQPGFDDSNWIVADLPHDYSIMNLAGGDGPDQIGPFSKKSPGGGRSNGKVLGGTAWYRKHFSTDKAEAGKNVVLNFDGVYMEAEIWVNGKQAGVHKNGYTPFWFDITPLLNPAGESNVIAVKVDNNGQNTRWYTGSGIYRNVRLIITQPVHTAVWGVKITTQAVNTSSATVDLAVKTQNDGDKPVRANVRVRIVNSEDKAVAEFQDSVKIEAHGNSVLDKQAEIQTPALWSLESPSLYRAEITTTVNNKVTDKYNQSFGIRTLGFSVEKGFLLNGVPVKLKGGCVHHDNGLLGSAAIERAEERKVEILKSNGFNAIRCSHNPPSEIFLNACDRLGMLVIDEFSDIWEAPKNPQDYSRFFKEWWKKDLSDFVMRDRNHPCIIMWSIGNEIPEKNDSSGLRIGRELTSAFKELDSSRPLTEAVNDNWSKRGIEWDRTADAFALLDVGGYNYEWKQMASDHAKYPKRIMFGSESFPYEAYDYWQSVEKNKYVIGDFVWTAMDYLGEVGLGNTQYIQYVKGHDDRTAVLNAALASSFSKSWPWFGAWCGDIDITGEKKPQKAYRDVIWDISKIEMNVHTPLPADQIEYVGMWGWPDEWPSWNWKGQEGKPLQVRVFTKAPIVKLELNGKVIGEKRLTAGDKNIAVFEVPFQPGELKAVAMDNDKEIASKVLNTTGKVTGLRLIADRSTIKADRNDLSYITVEAIDDNGYVVTDEPVKVKLSLTGDGEISASGNGSPDGMESFNKPTINTYKGKALVIIRPFAKPGDIILKAESGDIKSSNIEITAR